MKNILTILIGLVILAAALSGVSIWNEIQFIKELTSQQPENTDVQRPELKGLIRDKAFKESLLQISNSDSISMVINLKDSTISLFIKGVFIHQTKVRDYKLDPLLHHLPEADLTNAYYRPLKKISERSTIVKEPVVIREAPKDPLEASLNAYQPDTLIQNPAFVAFSLDTRLQLILSQDKDPAFRDRWSRLLFYQRVPFDSRPSIHLSLPVDDLRAIYRALPNDPFIVIHFPE